MKIGVLLLASPKDSVFAINMNFLGMGNSDTTSDHALKLQPVKDDGPANGAAASKLLLIPSKHDYDKTTHLLNGVVKVHNNSSFEYSLKGSVLLRATKIDSGFQIEDMTTIPGQPVPVAILAKAWTSCKHSVGYKLIVQKSTDVTCIVYTVPSLVKKLSDKAPRQAHLAVIDQKKKKEIQLVSCCHDICKKHGVNKLIELNNNDGVLVFPSKDPFCGKAGLHFSGRGKLASNKNMQLLDSKKRVIWQMAKVSSGEYHVDFRAPISSLQSFAVAVAQCHL